MILTKEDLYRKGFDFVIEALNRGESINLVPTAKVSIELEKELNDLIKEEVPFAQPFNIGKKS